MKFFILYSIVILLLIGCGDSITTETTNNTLRIQLPDVNNSLGSETPDTNDTSETQNPDLNDTSGTQNPDAPIPKSGIYETSDSEAVKYLKVVNYARGITRECGDRGTFEACDALRNNEDLYAAALEHSKDMAESNTFSHDGSGTSSDITGSNLGKKSTFDERIEANGYVNYRTIGENVALGYKTIEDAVDGWLDSPGHCENLMNPKFKEMGLAVYEGSSRLYWSHEFGAKK